MGLYKDGNEFERSLNKYVGISATLRSAKNAG